MSCFPVEFEYQVFERVDTFVSGNSIGDPVPLGGVFADMHQVLDALNAWGRLGWTVLNLNITRDEQDAGSPAGFRIWNGGRDLGAMPLPLITTRATTPLLLPDNKKAPRREPIASILLADESVLFRAGLRALLTRDDLFEVVGETNDAREAMHATRSLLPDIVLISLSSGASGIEAKEHISRCHPCAKVVLLIDDISEAYIENVFQSGAKGYLTKDSTNSDELIRAIRTVLDEKYYMSPEVVAFLVERYESAQKPRARKFDCLTPRERDVLALIAEQWTINSIADRLGLNVKSVAAYRRSVMRKLEVHDTADLEKVSRNFKDNG